jgi:hypothetical protein
MENEQSKDLQLGDVIKAHSRDRYNTVERVTPHRAVLNDGTVVKRKSNFLTGWEVRDPRHEWTQIGGMHFSRFRECSKEQIKAIDKEEKRKSLIYEIQDATARQTMLEYTYEEIKQIHAVVFPIHCCFLQRSKEESK